MTPDEALAVLHAYRDSRPHIPEAVATLRALGLTQQRIAQEAGMSRDGIAKLLHRTERDTDQ